jgi:hypothetical protein
MEPQERREEERREEGVETELRNPLITMHAQCVVKIMVGRAKEGGGGGKRRGGRRDEEEKKRKEEGGKVHFSPPQAPLGFEKTLGPSTKPLGHLESRWRSEDFSNTAHTSYCVLRDRII